MKKFLGLSLIIFCLTSCSTLLNGSTQTIRIKSNVVDAQVKVNTKEIGYTNQEITIKRSDLDGLIIVSSEGCKTKEVELPLKTATAFWGTSILGTIPIFGQLFVTIDLSNQNHLKTDEEIEINLDCDK